MNRRRRLGDDTQLTTYEIRRIWALVKYSNIFHFYAGLVLVVKSPNCPVSRRRPLGDDTRLDGGSGTWSNFQTFFNFYTESPHSRSGCPPTPGTLWEIVVFTKNSNRLSLIDSPMADSPIERRPRAMPDLGLSRIFKHFSTFTQSHHTRGVRVPRPKEDSRFHQTFQRPDAH